MVVIDKFLEQHSLTEEEYIKLLEYWNDEVVFARLKDEAVQIRKTYYGNKVHTRGVIDLPITVGITATIVVFGEIIVISYGIALLRKRFLHAVRAVMLSGIARLYCRAEKIRGIKMRI